MYTVMYTATIDSSRESAVKYESREILLELAREEIKKRGINPNTASLDSILSADKKVSDALLHLFSDDSIVDVQLTLGCLVDVCMGYRKNKEHITHDAVRTNGKYAEFASLSKETIDKLKKYHNKSHCACPSCKAITVEQHRSILPHDYN